MSKICQVFGWACIFVISAAITQLLSTQPWSMWVSGIFGLIFYSIGFKSNDWQMQMIAAGIIFGAIKCYFNG